MFGWFKKKSPVTFTKEIRYYKKWEVISEEEKEYTTFKGNHRFKFLTNEDKVIEFEEPYEDKLILSSRSDDLLKFPIQYTDTKDCQLDYYNEYHNLYTDSRFSGGYYGSRSAPFIPKVDEILIDEILYKVKAWISCEFIEKSRNVEKHKVRYLRQVIHEEVLD